MYEKLDRNNRLYHYHLNNPKLSYAKLGKVFHLDRAAVYRIIKRMEKKDGQTL